MKYELEVLSPVHIGSGETLSPIEYWIKGNTLKIADADNFFKKFTSEDVSSLSKSAEDRNFTLYEFAAKRRLNLSPKYEMVSKCRPRGDIHLEVKGVKNEVYIPGSSIKGAIRTAILYKWLKDGNSDKILGSEEVEDIKTLYQRMKIVHDRRERNYIKRNLNKKLGNFISNLERKAFRGKENDPKYDIFKYIQISDTSSRSPEESLELRLVQILEMDVRGRRVDWYRRRNREVQLYLECLKQGINFTGYIKPVKEPKALESLKLREEKLSIEYILGACRTFSRDLNEHEIEFGKKYRINFLVSAINELKNEQEHSGEKEALMKLGWGSGFLSTTISMFVKEEDEELYKAIVSMAPRGYEDEFPKTRRIVFEDEEPRYPPGWVKIKVGD